MKFESIFENIDDFYSNLYVFVGVFGSDLFNLLKETIQIEFLLIDINFFTNIQIIGKIKGIKNKIDCDHVGIDNETNNKTIENNNIQD